MGYVANRDATVYAVFSVLSFLCGILLYSHFDPYFLLRQTASFTITLIGILLLFVRLGVSLEEFLSAAVVASVAYAAFAVLMVTTKGFSLADIYLIKGGLREYVPDWPQRYVVVLLFAFFVSLARWSRGYRWQIASVIIIACIFLTFLRAAWLGVLGGLVAYYFAGWRTGDHAPDFRRTSRIHLYVGATVAVGLLIWALSHEDIRSAFSLIFDNIMKVVAMNPAELNPDSSAGYRLEVWSSILEVLTRNPISGTGFAGVNLVVEGLGSAHNEYFDVLLRTGAIGFLIYMWFWTKLLRHYWRTDRGVTGGLVALLILGCFHETTKLSYGALIFFFLLNKAYEDARPSGPPRVRSTGAQTCVPS